MATTAELTRLRVLAGKQLPEGDADPADYTDEQLLAYLDAVPECTTHPTHADVYAAAALAWEDKALAVDLELTANGGAGPLVDQASQGDASVTFTRPTRLGTVVTQPNDPAAMRVMASRLRRRSCTGSRFKALDVQPPNVVVPGRHDRMEYDGGTGLYHAPRSAILDPVGNPDRVLNLPEVD